MACDGPPDWQVADGKDWLMTLKIFLSRQVLPVIVPRRHLRLSSRTVAFFPQNDTESRRVLPKTFHGALYVAIPQEMATCTAALITFNRPLPA